MSLFRTSSAPRPKHCHTEGGRTVRRVCVCARGLEDGGFVSGTGSCIAGYVRVCALVGVPSGGPMVYTVRPLLSGPLLFTNIPNKEIVGNRISI